MANLKLAMIEDDKPVRLTLKLPAKLHRDLTAYGRVLGGEAPVAPAKLIAPRLKRFMASDREFAKARRS